MTSARRVLHMPWGQPSASSPPPPPPPASSPLHLLRVTVAAPDRLDEATQCVEVAHTTAPAAVVLRHLAELLTHTQACNTRVPDFVRVAGLEAGTFTPEALAAAAPEAVIETRTQALCLAAWEQNLDATTGQPVWPLISLPGQQPLRAYVAYQARFQTCPDASGVQVGRGRSGWRSTDSSPAHTPFGCVCPAGGCLWHQPRPAGGGLAHTAGSPGAVSSRGIALECLPGALGPSALCHPRRLRWGRPACLQPG
jgi:hypothetical protein